MNISLFGPLDKSYCEIFNYLGIFLIVMFGIYTISTILIIFFSKTIKQKFLSVFIYFLFMILLGIQYVFLGLLHNMCRNSKDNKNSIAKTK